VEAWGKAGTRKVAQEVERRAAEEASRTLPLWKRLLIGAGIGGASLPLAVGPSPDVDQETDAPAEELEKQNDKWWEQNGVFYGQGPEVVSDRADNGAQPASGPATCVEEPVSGIELGPNPWGQPGNPDHQNTINDRIKKERKSPANIGKNIRPGRKGDVPGKDWIPDAVVEDPETEKIERVIEIGRTNSDGKTPVSREKRKQKYYEEIHLPCTWVPTKKAPDKIWEKLRRQRERQRREDKKENPDPGPRPPKLKY
jgi:hypothetical protein